MPAVPTALIEEIEFRPSLHDAFQLLACRAGSFLLESAAVEGRRGRWTLVGSEPFLSFAAKRRQVTVGQKEGSERLQGNPFSLLKPRLEAFRLERPAGAPPLIGGAVGYFGYDLCQVLERLPDRAEDDLSLADCWLGFYDVVAAIDQVEHRAFISSCGWPETTEWRRQERARRRLEETKRLLARLSAQAESLEPVLPRSAAPQLHSNFTREEYLQAILRAKEYIAAGDIYQVNLSQRFSSPLDCSAGELYRRLRRLNPAPFAGLLSGDDWALVSASPERFLQVRGDWVETRPIKGTRPRGSSREEDERLAAELVASEKDRAENVMIVDLERNDLGKVCEYGSVQTTELWALESYPTVFHLVSTVEGRLRAGRSARDCLRACFPGGSITGAPKVRAMEIIEELEPTKRGPYTGAMGYLCFSGDMDLNIVIRTFVVKEGWAHFQVGGGIVADSEPEAEYQETLDKGRALEWALAGEKCTR